MAWALAPLATFVLVCWVIAFVAMLAVILGYVAGVLHGLPFPLNQLAGPVEAASQGLSNACGRAFAKSEQLLGASWHLLARYSERVWHSIETGQSLNSTAATVAVGHAAAINKLAARWRSQRASVTAHSAEVKQLEREWHGIEHRVKVLEREFHGIDETGIGKKLASLDKAIETINTQTIPSIRSRAAADEGAFADLKAWLGINVGVNYGDWAIALATTLLGAIGLGNLRCSNFGNLLSKWACGLGSLLDDLLGLMVSVLALEAVCDFLPLIEGAFGTIIGPLVHILNEVPLGKCETPDPSWAQLSVATGPLPPAQSLGTFPS